MKKSEFIFVKCKGCGKPYPARPKCKPKPRPEECNYCPDCLTFKSGFNLLINNFEKRLDDMENELYRLIKLHEQYMKKVLYEEN